MNARTARLCWLAGLVLAACNGGPARGPTAADAADGAPAAAPQVLRRGNGAEPVTLDPHKAEGDPELGIVRDLFEGLVGEAQNGSLEPGAAESWQVAADGKTYTFALRPDARWSNGDPVTADDFVYGFRRSLDPKTGSRYRFILAPIQNAEAVAAGNLAPTALGVRAVDERTLEIALERPTPYFLGLLTHPSTYPVHRADVAANGELDDRPGELISNGAYRLARWVRGSYVEATRNPFYWDDASTRIDTVYYYPTHDVDAELDRYRAGKLDMTYAVPKKQIRSLRESRPAELAVAPYFAIYYYGLNLTRPPFKDNLALRRALALAIDRDFIAREVTGAGEIPAYGWVPPLPSYAGQHMPEAEWSQPERETEARRLYAQAGYSREHPLEIEILYNTQEDHERVARAIAAMWKRVLGVETRLKSEEWKVYLESRNRFESQVFRASWVGDYDDAFTFLGLLASQSGLNSTGYADARYERLLRAAETAEGPVARALALEEAERVLLDDMPVIPVYFYVTARMVAPWVRGYEENAMDHHLSKDLAVLPH
ncbi:MAG TPA: peptide ABC transporter substrate-binding protein [Gammaproteobacteria bacterium]|nr:peptide ABC transporter substrate-binding protein [Gammaproteobacteria bacterium]